jgi:hypothetical protein
MEGMPSDDLSISGNTLQPPEIAHGVGITGQRFRWPSGRIPFTVVAELRDRVRATIDHWEANTRIRFVERTGANAPATPELDQFRSARRMLVIGGHAGRSTGHLPRGWLRIRGGGP